MTSEALERYRALESQLVRVRWIHGGLESPEEDDILDEMDGAWSKLTNEERVQINAEPSRSLLRAGAPATRLMRDADVWTYPELPPRRKEAA